MSNLNQFQNSGGIPIGGTITIPPTEPVYTAPDGTQWIAAAMPSAFTYTNSYSALPDIMTSPHQLLAGPESDGFWAFPLTSTFNAPTGVVAYSTVTNTYCTAGYVGVGGSDAYTYYYGTGTNWTEGTFTNTNSVNAITCVGDRFIVITASATTNAVMTSTDAINWIGSNFTSGIIPTDVAWDNGSNIYIAGTTTTGQWSSDGGATWTNSSQTTPSSSVNTIPGQGTITWNAGAGLFIMATSTAGYYQTSPTGQTWTLKNAQTSYRKYSDRFSTNAKFASSPTTTVAFGISGCFLTTTDGLTWSNFGVISPTLGSQAPTFAFYDGVRFVVGYSVRLFYSTNGTTWIEAKPGGYGNTPTFSISNGRIFAFFPTQIPSQLMMITDVTASTPQLVVPASGASWTTGISTHYRVK
jgi:hypothetical protein